MSYGKVVQGFKHYFGHTLDNGEDLGAYFGSPSTEPVIARPAERAPTDQQGRTDTNSLDWILWRDEGKQYSERVKKLKSNRTTIFITIFTQCSRGVITKLEALDQYKARSDNFDVVWLLQQLRDICNQFEKTEQRHLGLFRAMLTVVNHRQGANQTTSDYYDTLIDLIDVYEAYGGKLQNPPDRILTGDAYRQMTEDQLESAMRQYAIATMLIENADDGRYGSLKKDLRNHFSRGTDQYPHQTGTDADAQLIWHHDDANMKRRPNRKAKKDGGRGRGGGGGRGTGGRGGRNNSGINASTGQQSVSHHITLAQLVSDHFPHGIPSNNVMLDSESTVNVFCNDALLTNVHDVDSVLHIISNGGTTESAHQHGHFAGVGSVWYGNSIANILSMSRVRQAGCRIFMDTDTAATVFLRLTKGHVMEFHEHSSGLYLHDAGNANLPSTAVTATSQPVHKL